MQQDNPFAAFGPPIAPPPAGPTALRPLATLPPSPSDVRAERQFDYSVSRDAVQDARADAATRRAEVAADRADRREQRQIQLDSAKLAKEDKPSESERTAAFLATRLAGSLADVNRLTKANPAAARPELDTAIFGGIVGRGATNTADRQRVEDAQLDVLDAALTLGTGAAYTREQLESYRQSYFPQYWDTPAAVADKQARLDRVLKAARIKSGSAAGLIDRALATTPESGVGALAPQVQPATVDNVADVLSGLSGGKYTIERNGLFYTPPNGRPEPVDASDAVVNSDEYRSAYRAKFGEEPELQVTIEGGRVDPTSLPVARGQGGIGETADAFIRGAADAVSLGAADEIAAAGRTIFGEGTLRDNLRGERAVDAYDQQNNFGARTTGQLAGGVALPIGAGARTAGELARVGALSGAGYGFGSSEGGVVERVPGAAGGALAGAVGGYAFGRAAPAVGGALSRLRSSSATRQEAGTLREAAERQQVPLAAADLRPGARNMTAFLEASPGGAGPTQRAMMRGNDALEAAAGRIGGGSVQTPEAIGSMVQDAGRRTIAWSRDRKNELYAAAERLAGDTTVPSRTAVANLEGQIQELAETPNANRGLLSLLQDMRADLVDEAGNLRPLSIGAIRRLRTAMRGEIGGRNLTMTDAERRVSDVIDAASADITAALQQANPRAAEAYRRADAFYAQRQAYVRDVVQNYTGPRDRPLSGEQAYARIMALTRPNGDRQRLIQTIRALSADERADVASTVAASLGRSSPEDDFSPARFVSQAERMTPGARLAVFGSEGAAAVDDLIRIAGAKRDTASSLNRSRSGQVSNYERMLTGGLSLLGAGGGYAAGGVAGAAVGAAAAAGAKATALNLSARLLTNPAFVRWLGRAPRTSDPAVITGHVRRLSAIAVQQPALRGEIVQLQQRLTQTVVRPSVAAEPENDVGTAPVR